MTASSTLRATTPASARGRIAVEHLTESCPGFNAVDDLSFTVESGRVTGFLGPNGTGETTTLRMLLGLVEPVSGTATIGGTCYVDLERPPVAADVMISLAKLFDRSPAQ